MLKALGLGLLTVLAAGCGEAPDALGTVEEPWRAGTLVWGGERRLVAADSAELDQFGYSVSLAENRALVGAYGESLYHGAAYVYVREGDVWREEQKLVASDGVEGDSFGWSVSLGADRLLIGAYARDSSRGAAYVFVWNGDSWLEEQKLVLSDGADSDNFGWSVSLSEDRALVGAFGRDSRGAAYLFNLSNGEGNEEQKLVADGGSEGDLFAYSVALAPGRALVGAPGNEEMRGAAYLFTPDDSAWAQVAKLTARDGAADDQFGVSVSLAADRALVGAHWDESLRGAAYVFSEDGGSWSEEQKLTASDGAAGHRFGNAVSLGVDRALVGAFGCDDARGAAYAFARTGGSWSEEQKLVASDGAGGDLFGWSVALAADRALAGAHYDDVLRGAAYVLENDTPPVTVNPGSGCQTTKRTPSDSGWSLGALGLLVLARRRRRPPRLVNALPAVALSALFALGCAGGENGGGSAAGAGAPGSSGTEAGGVGGSAASGWEAGGAGGGTSDCVGTHVATSKRVVRLTEYQLHNSYAALFGADAAAIITADEDRPSIADRELPPISGEVGVSEGLFAKVDRLAQAAMRYVSENAGALASCGTTPTDAACVREYLLSFAEKAFRHPLDAAEKSALLGRFWDEMVDSGASVTQALAFGVYGVLSSPSFVYRTEYGADPAVDGPLTPYELATVVSLFLTDGPPDDELLAAARTNQLGTPELVRAQASRILETEGARRNLEQALLRYFSFARAGGVILNPEATPGLTVTSGMQASIVHEGELFVKNLLWSGPLVELLTAQRTWTTADLATGIYGVSAPSQVDPDGFGLVELPPDRSGLLTLSTFLLSGARSTGSSPVARGLTINASIVCAVNQPFPEVVNPLTGQLERDPAITSAIAVLAGESELVKSQYRASTPKCAGCHLDFDAFGMVLEPYDAVGRFRTMDLEGRPIDERSTTTVLPESVGGATVTNVVEAAHAIAESGVLDRCMAMNFINYALTEVSKGGATNADLGRAPQTGTCAVQGVLERFESTDRSFSALMREIAASDTLALRAKGL